MLIFYLATKITISLNAGTAFNFSDYEKLKAGKAASQKGDFAPNKAARRNILRDFR